MFENRKDNETRNDPSVLQYISFAQAVKLIEQMEKLGLIEPSEGLKPRRILLSPAQWEAVKKQHVALSSAQLFFGSISIEDGSKDEQPQQQEALEPPDIVLRDFEEFRVDGVKLSVHDNRVFISKPIMTLRGKGHCDPNFDGRAIAGLVYQKPHLFSKGHIQFDINPSAPLHNSNPEIYSLEREDLPELLTVQFGIRDEE